MSYFNYLKSLLYPMRLYDFDSELISEELKSIGLELDGVEADYDEIIREGIVSTAELEGLSKWESLFPFRVLASTTQERRDALSALMRIDGESFTLEAINDTLRGSGIVAVATELSQPMTVQIHFPFIKGVPSNIGEVSKRIAEIIPCHLNTVYKYYYTTWRGLLDNEVTWRDILDKGLNWRGLEFEYVQF